MSNDALRGQIPTSFCPVKCRPISCLPEDTAAVLALAQAAVNVENFTIPLYLAAMSSIQGTHTISNPLAQGRLWPGMSTTAGTTLTSNQRAYNTVFSVFIQEMLHLQLAANLATVLGASPQFFDKTLLQNANGGWACYGPTLTTIPHIVDLTDTTSFANVKVNLAALTTEQIQLFLAIEQSHDDARADIKADKLADYFPAVPFENWTAKNTEADLPQFGTIGWMYQCFMQYLAIEYEGGVTLWSKLFDASRLDQQRDIFNGKYSGHSRDEYPLMPMKISASDPDMALLQAIDMINGIVNQGEGGVENLLKGFRLQVQRRIYKNVSLDTTVGLRDEVTDNAVETRFRPDRAALIVDYPYEPGNVDARSHGDVIDHWDRFNELQNVVQEPDYLNFAQWYAAGNAWTGADLQTSAYQPQANLPSPDDVATSLNAMRTGQDYPQLLGQLVAGAVDGINKALTQYWASSTARFPYQAMAASGDRMSLYWAVFGEAPDLSASGSLPPITDADRHACQGLSVQNPGNSCAALAAYHTCSSSNSCKGLGGCGYPIIDTAGNSKNFIAPSDNTCNQKGGCAVPISVFQTYGSGGTMDIADIFSTPPATLGTFDFTQNQTVYAAAWTAYTAVMNAQQPPVAAGNPPAASPLRMVLPPN